MRAHVVNEIKTQITPRVLQACSMFDVPPDQVSRQEWDVALPLGERDWNIGLIVGPSGAGKTSVARGLFGSDIISGFDWPTDRSVLDGFAADSSIRDVVGMLTAVGFGSPPSWLRPYHALSTGEQFRVTMARALALDAPLVVIDEFSSVIDRRVAQVGSHTIQKTVRRAKKQFVAVTCHYDVTEWLQPDWIYQPHTNQFSWRSLQRKPTLELAVHKIGAAAWPLFKRHHYLSGDLHVGAQCFGGFVDGECIAFSSYLHFPHPRTKNIKMGHRLVVLPDWQGLGIGGRFDDWLGQWLYERGYRYRNVVAHPSMIAYYLKSPRWRQTHSAQRVLHASTTKERWRTSQLRPRALGLTSFEYMAVP